MSLLSSRRYVNKTAAAMLSYNFNFGGVGTAPTNSGWINVWGEPYVDADLNADVDFLNVGSTGIDMRCVNNASPNCWGELGNSAIGNTGETVGVYPSTVMSSYWFVSNRTAVLELSGSILSGKTWTVKLFGSRNNSGGATGPRTVKFNVNSAGIVSVDCFQNTATLATFTGVVLVSSKISISVGFTSPQQFAYLNAMELIQTA